MHTCTSYRKQVAGNLLAIQIYVCMYDVNSSRYTRYEKGLVSMKATVNSSTNNKTEQ